MVDGRVWAVDLSVGSGGSAPKFFVAATATDFVASYMRVTPSERHAYEIIEAQCGCFAYFDLDASAGSTEELQQSAVAAQALEAEIIAVLMELAARREANADVVQVDIHVLDATRPPTADRVGKFSRHMICRASRRDAPWLLRGPAEAGIVARLVSERLRASGLSAAAELIDLAVYGGGRAFRLVGSTKLADPRSRPLEYRGASGAALPEAAVLASLVAPATQPATLPAQLVLSPTRATAYAPRAAPAPCPPCAKAPRTAASTRDETSARSGRWWSHVTEMPRLDMPRLPHPSIAHQCHGNVRGAPAALAPLLVWADTQLRERGGGAAAQWRYERASAPSEMLVHVTGSERGVCAHIGRAHVSWHVMVTLDLLNDLAWLRCWDQQCIVRCRGGEYVKAKHSLGSLPPELSCRSEHWKHALERV